MQRLPLIYTIINDLTIRTMNKDTLDKEFDEEFGMPEFQLEFVKHGTRTKDIKSFINKNYISKREVEEMKAEAKKHPMLRDGKELKDWNEGYMSALEALKKR